MENSLSGFENASGRPPGHAHVFLGKAHEQNERRTWAVIWLCIAMMMLEVIGGLWFGSIALVADGLHMSTHAGALLLTALAYTFARRYAHDPRFSFGTGKLGDLAGFTSAIILGLIALGIGAEAIHRFFTPVPIHFREAIPIAVLGLMVNLLSAWLLGAGDDHDHGHNHDHHHADYNMRAALVHVLADAAVSVFVIAGLMLAKLFGWLWMDPLAGVIGAIVISSWAVTLVRDTGAILLDMTPDAALVQALCALVAEEGDELTDLHLWRLGPGHFGAILSVRSAAGHDAAYYHERLAELGPLSHITVEILPVAEAALPGYKATGKERENG